MARTKLMKLLFLIDRELHRRFGSTVFRWKMYKYGPFSREVLDVLDNMEVYGSVVVKVADYAIIYELASTAPRRASAGGEGGGRQDARDVDAPKSRRTPHVCI
jgi:uncharacterized protein YwgA